MAQNTHPEHDPLLEQQQEQFKAFLRSGDLNSALALKETVIENTLNRGQQLYFKILFEEAIGNRAKVIELCRIWLYEEKSIGVLKRLLELYKKEQLFEEIEPLLVWAIEHINLGQKESIWKLIAEYSENTTNPTHKELFQTTLANRPAMAAAATKVAKQPSEELKQQHKERLVRLNSILKDGSYRSVILQFEEITTTPEAAHFLKEYISLLIPYLKHDTPFRKYIANALLVSSEQKWKQKIMKEVFSTDAVSSERMFISEEDAEALRSLWDKKMPDLLFGLESLSKDLEALFTPESIALFKQQELWLIERYTSSLHSNTASSSELAWMKQLLSERNTVHYLAWICADSKVMRKRRFNQLIAVEENEEHITEAIIHLNTKYLCDNNAVTAAIAEFQTKISLAKKMPSKVMTPQQTLDKLLEQISSTSSSEQIEEVVTAVQAAAANITPGRSLLKRILKNCTTLPLKLFLRIVSHISPLFPENEDKDMVIREACSRCYRSNLKEYDSLTLDFTLKEAMDAVQIWPTHRYLYSILAPLVFEDGRKEVIRWFLSSGLPTYLSKYDVDFESATKMLYHFSCDNQNNYLEIPLKEGENYENVLFSCKALAQKLGKIGCFEYAERFLEWLQQKFKDRWYMLSYLAEQHRERGDTLKEFVCEQRLSLNHRTYLSKLFYQYAEAVENNTDITSVKEKIDKYHGLLEEAENNLLEVCTKDPTLVTLGVDAKTNASVLKQYYEGLRAVIKVLTANNQKDTAEVFYKTARKIFPDHTRPLLIYGFALYQTNNLQDAEEIFREIVEKLPSGIVLRNTYAVCLSFSHKYDEATAVAKETLTLSPHDKVAKTILAKTLARMGNTRDAIEICRGIILEHPGDTVSQEFFKRLTSGKTEYDVMYPLGKGELSEVLSE